MKNINPLLSVIINCHNGEKYLKESILSVINQNYSNWELIFWDNASTDKSSKIFKSFKDNRLKYFKSKKFLNLYQARNEAVKVSKGKYISFLDSDDKWLVNKIEEQINFFSNNKEFKIVYSNYYIKHHKQKKKLNLKMSCLKEK